MSKQLSTLLTRLRRLLAADPGRYAGGSAVSGPEGLLAIEFERRAATSREPGDDANAESGEGK
jgi:hypothetical protein